MEVHRFALPEFDPRFFREDAEDSARARVIAYFRRRQGDLARLLTGAFRSLANSVDETLEKISGVSPASLVGKEDLDDIVRTNTQLIRTASQQHVQRVAKLYREQGLGAKTREAATKEIQKAVGVSQRKAEFWARDQTLKTHAGMTKRRAVAVGLNRYVWITSNDERVRDTHADLDGQTFSFDNPPTTNDEGDTNNPGEDYNCRCTPDLLLE